MLLLSCNKLWSIEPLLRERLGQNSWSEVLAVIQCKLVNKIFQAAIVMPLLLLKRPNRLTDNVPDLLHCLVARVIVWPQPQTLLVHAHHSRRQALTVPAGKELSALTPCLACCRL